jgi:hypothetical protein
MAFTPQNPLVVQFDRTVLLEVQNDLHEEARDGLARFAELEKSPEYLHTFRITADLQARRRLGLTATLVREDGHEKDVVSLIGPKKYDVPWKVLEKQGWIATAECHEIRLHLPDDLRMEYALTDEREKYRFAAENPLKLRGLDQLLTKHRHDNGLIIGQYIGPNKLDPRADNSRRFDDILARLTLRGLELIQRGPVPEALARRLRAWAKHYGDAALDEVMLLQVRDPATLNELLADPDIAPLLQPFAPATTKARPACARKMLSNCAPAWPSAA